MSHAKNVGDELERAGFTSDQIQALLDNFALHPHTHDIDDIIGLDQELSELEEEEDEE